MKSRVWVIRCLLVLSICFGWMFPRDVRCQSGNSSWDIGLLAGATGFTGDLNMSALPRCVGGHGGFLARYQISEMYNVRLALLASSAHGIYKESRYYLPSYDRGQLTQFSSLFLGIEACAEIHFMRFEVNDFARQRHNTRFFTPYVTLGFGGGANYLLSSRDEMKGLFYIPMGGGVKFAVGGRFCIAPEVRFFKLFTDRVDAYTSWPMGKGDVSVHNRDWLSLVTLTFSYRLFTNVQLCPVYQR